MLGIIAVVFGVTPIMFWAAFPLGVLAVVFGWLGRYRAKKGQASNGRAAFAGFILGIVSLVLAVIWTSILVVAVNDAVTELDQPGTSTPRASAPAAPAVTEEPAAPAMTNAQEQAVGKAQDYLSFSAFSRSGLIEQLEYEGFSTKDAKFAVDHIEVNWNEQAAQKAKDYLDFSHFSRSGLIDQLVYEGFTSSQAVYGVDHAGL